ncbi:unnamed protein product [Scytosiphon promiscuus]
MAPSTFLTKDEPHRYARNERCLWLPRDFDFIPFSLENVGDCNLNLQPFRNSMRRDVRFRACQRVSGW